MAQTAFTGSWQSLSISLAGRSLVCAAVEPRVEVKQVTADRMLRPVGVDGRVVGRVDDRLPKRSPIP